MQVYLSLLVTRFFIHSGRAIERSRSRRMIHGPMSTSTLADISIDSMTADDLPISPIAADTGTRRIYSSMEEATQAKMKSNKRASGNPAPSAEELLAQLNAL